MKRVYFVRHGETEGNLKKFFQFPDTELSALGKAQAEKVGSRLSGMMLDALVSSPFERAQQTAKIIAKHTGLAVETFNDFHEHMQAQSVRGKSHESEEGALAKSQWLANYLKDDVYEEGFENYKSIVPRLESCCGFLKKHESDHIVVVSHCTFIHALAAYMLLQESSDKDSNVTVASSLGKMSNAAITVFQYEKEWQLLTWNDHAHFAE